MYSKAFISFAETFGTSFGILGAFLFFQKQPVYTLPETITFKKIETTQDNIKLSDVRL